MAKKNSTDYQSVQRILDESVAKPEYQGMSRMQIIDSVLYSGKVTWGNENDWVNCMNRVAPHITYKESSKIYNELNEITDNGDILNYVISDVKPETSFATFEIDALFLVFNLEK